MIDGQDLGSCMVANKVPGVRAAMAYDYASASNSRDIMTPTCDVGRAGLIGTNQAKLILKNWLATEFAVAGIKKESTKLLLLKNSIKRKQSNMVTDIKQVETC